MAILPISLRAVAWIMRGSRLFLIFAFFASARIRAHTHAGTPARHPSAGPQSERCDQAPWRALDSGVARALSGAYAARCGQRNSKKARNISRLVVSDDLAPPLAPFLAVTLDVYRQCDLFALFHHGLLSLALLRGRSRGPDGRNASYRLVLGPPAGRARMCFFFAFQALPTCRTRSDVLSARKRHGVLSYLGVLPTPLRVLGLGVVLRALKPTRKRCARPPCALNAGLRGWPSCRWRLAVGNVMQGKPHRTEKR